MFRLERVTCPRARLQRLYSTSVSTGAHCGAHSAVLNLAGMHDMHARMTAPHPEGVEIPAASDRVRAENLPCYIKLLRRAHFCLLFQMIHKIGIVCAFYPLHVLKPCCIFYEGLCLKYLEKKHVD